MGCKPCKFRRHPTVLGDSNSDEFTTSDEDSSSETGDESKNLTTARFCSNSPSPVPCSNNVADNNGYVLTWDNNYKNNNLPLHDDVSQQQIGPVDSAQLPCPLTANGTANPGVEQHSKHKKRSCRSVQKSDITNSGSFGDKIARIFLWTPHRHRRRRRRRQQSNHSQRTSRRNKQDDGCLQSNEVGNCNNSGSSTACNSNHHIIVAPSDNCNGNDDAANDVSNNRQSLSAGCNPVVYTHIVTTTTKSNTTTEPPSTKSSKKKNKKKKKRKEKSKLNGLTNVSPTKSGNKINNSIGEVTDGKYPGKLIQPHQKPVVSSSPQQQQPKNQLQKPHNARVALSTSQMEFFQMLDEKVNQRRASSNTDALSTMS